MLSVILVALFQAAAGGPADTIDPPATEEAAATEQRTERRRVCRRYEVTGARVRQQRCTYEDVPVRNTEEDEPPPVNEAQGQEEQAPATGGASPAAQPTAPSPQ